MPSRSTAPFTAPRFCPYKTLGVSRHATKQQLAARAGRHRPGQGRAHMALPRDAEEAYQLLSNDAFRAAWDFLAATDSGLGRPRPREKPWSRQGQHADFVEKIEAVAACEDAGAALGALLRALDGLGRAYAAVASGGEGAWRGLRRARGRVESVGLQVQRILAEIGRVPDGEWDSLCLDARRLVDKTREMQARVGGMSGRLRVVQDKVRAVLVAPGNGRRAAKRAVRNAVLVWP